MRVAARAATALFAALLGGASAASAKSPAVRFVDGATKTETRASIPGVVPGAVGAHRVEVCDASGERTVTLSSRDEKKKRLDERALALGAADERGCRLTPAFDLAMDPADRDDPSRAAPAVVARAGGAVVASLAGVSGDLAVVGPVPEAPLVRLRLHVTLVRTRAGGPPPIGTSDRRARALVEAEIERARGVLSQCGVLVADTVRLVDPDPAPLVAVGCEHGLAATGGGKVTVRGEKGLSVETATVPGESPRAVARRLASAMEHAGFDVTLADTPRIGQGAGEGSDLVLRKGGKVLAVEKVTSTDATLAACLGRIDLTDGLSHFTDLDAPTGTLEERALLRTVTDGDPTTLDVVVVPSFATAGRIGESFIVGDQGSFPATVILDRAGIRAGEVSFALAHEIGHVLLDLPGHADDFGRDTPSELMDSDAGDASAHGPRRLSVAECKRMVRTFGPGRPLPLLGAP